MRNLKIDPEFHGLIPPMSAEEQKQLEANIKADGCEIPLDIWKGTIIDGHNRYAICQRLKLSFKTHEREFKSRGEAMAWIIRNQFGRRNLTHFQRGELALKLEPLIAKKAKSQQGVRTDISQKSVKSVDTQKEVARAAGVSHDTIHKVKVISERAPEAMKQKLRSGELKIHTAYKQLRAEPETERPGPVRRQKLHVNRPTYTGTYEGTVKLTDTLRAVEKSLNSLIGANAARGDRLAITEIAQRCAALLTRIIKHLEA